jgi:AraC-like DNA-binding protein
MAFVRAMVLAYEQYGREPDHALAQVGITRAQLRKADARINADQMETFSAIAMRELDDEALGWFSRRLPWGTYGMLCRASLRSPTLLVALKRWCRHHGLLTEDVRLEIRAEGDAVRLLIEEHTPLGAMREFCLLTSLRYVHGYACWLVDSQLPLDEVTFPFAPPPHHSAYRFLFPGPVRFEAGAASMLFDARYMALAPSRDENALQRMLQHALPLTVRQYRRDRLLTERVRAWLFAHASESASSTEVAKAMGLSVRSLHRHLGDDGTSLQRLKTDVRRRRALDLLVRGDLPIKQLARAVGFRSAKSFARAFHEWTGQSPSAYRTAVHSSAPTTSRAANAQGTASKTRHGALTIATLNAAPRANEHAESITNHVSTDDAKAASAHRSRRARRAT